jgi:hypothetical protein
MVDVPFVDFAFPASGAPTNRTMPARLAEVVDVKDFGATGAGDPLNAGPDDVIPLQRAINAAFTNATEASNYTTAPGGGAPVANGITNAHLNRTLYFPNGNYLISAPLILPQVYGGRIVGSGMSSTSITFVGSVASGEKPALSTNGFENSSIENISIVHVSGRNTTFNNYCIDLSWDGTSPVKLRDVLLLNLGLGGCRTSIRIAENGNGGEAITCLQCNILNCEAGISLNGDNASLLYEGGGILECFYGVWVKKGSAFLNAVICAGAYKAAIPLFPGQTDIRHDSTGITTFLSGRTESQNAVYVTAGKVHLIAIQNNLSENPGPPPGVMGPVTIPSPGGFGPTCVDGTGGEVILNGMSLGNVASSDTGLIRGSGIKLSLRNVSWGVDEDHFANFTGTIVQYIAIAPFTCLTLPPHPGDGLMVSVNDISGIAGRAWGSTILTTDGGSTGHGLVRFNGTVWTLVGK